MSAVVLYAIPWCRTGSATFGGPQPESSLVLETRGWPALQGPITARKKSRDRLRLRTAPSRDWLVQKPLGCRSCLADATLLTRVARWWNPLQNAWKMKRMPPGTIDRCQLRGSRFVRAERRRCISPQRLGSSPPFFTRVCPAGTALRPSSKPKPCRAIRHQVRAVQLFYRTRGHPCLQRSIFLIRAELIGFPPGSCLQP